MFTLILLLVLTALTVFFHFVKKQGTMSASVFIVLGIGLLFIFSCEDSGNSELQNVTLPTEENTINTGVAAEQGWNCSQCAKLISGRGFEELSEGIWKPCKEPYQCQVCSPECGRKHTAEMNSLMDSLSTSLDKCTNCDRGSYKEGFCNICGAASQEKVEESKSKMADCSLCNGTGIEKATTPGLTGETGRICPMCDGTGKKF